MARTRSKSNLAETIELETEPKKISWGDSYGSLLLGMVVVVVVGFIIFSFVKNKENIQQTSSDKTSTQEEVDKSKSSGLPKTYTVVAGDDLWTISEKMYKSGYNWVDVAKANSLTSPNVIHVGLKLTIPDVKPKIITMANQNEKVSQTPVPNAIKGNSYTVVSGDNLWDISVRAYSDGYKWVDIANANKLANPDLIFAGDKLTIPR